MGLLAAAPSSAQEIVELPPEDRWLENRFEEVYRLGSLETAEDWERFGSIRRVGFDGAGKLYVFDDMAKRIFVVGPGGNLQRMLGGPGEGPGEFRTPDGLAVMRDDRVVIADMGGLTCGAQGHPGPDWQEGDREASTQPRTRRRRHKCCGTQPHWRSWSSRVFVATSGIGLLAYLGTGFFLVLRTDSEVLFFSVPVAAVGVAAWVAGADPGRAAIGSILGGAIGVPLVLAKPSNNPLIDVGLGVVAHAAVTTLASRIHFRRRPRP